MDIHLANDGRRCGLRRNEDKLKIPCVMNYFVLVCLDGQTAQSSDFQTGKFDFEYPVLF